MVQSLGVVWLWCMFVGIALVCLFGVKRITLDLWGSEKKFVCCLQGEVWGTMWKMHWFLCLYYEAKMVKIWMLAQWLIGQGGFLLELMGFDKNRVYEWGFFTLMSVSDQCR